MYNLRNNFQFFNLLHQEGKERQFQLGQYNRKRYAHFLSENYNPDEILVKSTDIKRTIESAQYHLAGLYPSDQQQTIPINQLSEEEG